MSSDLGRRERKRASGVEGGGFSVEGGGGIQKVDRWQQPGLLGPFSYLCSSFSFRSFEM